MRLGLVNDGLNTKSKLGRNILAFFCNIIKPPKTSSKSPTTPKQPKAPSHPETGLCEKNGRLRCITKGKRNYLIINIEDSYDKILIGLREDDDEAWIKRVGEKVEK
ncbi:MAG: hypothetical protein DRP65_05450 [Planctomycetota bacterium]|nr:MAG: hypothetical protein DRP65_05450 [Planctomycetota bacterium]